MDDWPDPLDRYLRALFARAHPSMLVEVRWHTPADMNRRFARADNLNRVAGIISGPALSTGRLRRCAAALAASSRGQVSGVHGRRSAPAPRMLDGRGRGQEDTNKTTPGYLTKQRKKLACQKHRRGHVSSFACFNMQERGTCSSPPATTSTRASSSARTRARMTSTSTRCAGSSSTTSVRRPRRRACSPDPRAQAVARPGARVSARVRVHRGHPEAVRLRKVLLAPVARQNSRGRASAKPSPRGR